MSDEDIAALQDELAALRVWVASIRRHAEEGLDSRAFLAEADRPWPLSGTLALREIERMRQSLHAIIGAVMMCEEAGRDQHP